MKRILLLVICFVLTACMALFLVFFVTIPPTQTEKYDQMIRPVVIVTMASGAVGSGVVIKSDSHTFIISKEHVTKNEEWLKVEINGEVYDGELIKEDEEVDLSLLRVAAHTDYVAIIHNKSLSVFDEVFVVGKGAEDVVYPSFGIIANPLNKEEMVQFSAPVVNGVSGGGVFRQHKGHYDLVGIIDSFRIAPIRITPRQFQGLPVFNIGFATPMETVNEFLGGEL